MDSFNYFVKACSWLKTDFSSFLQYCFIIAPVLWNLTWHKAKCFRDFFFYIPPKPSLHQIIYSYNFDKRRATIIFILCFILYWLRIKRNFQIMMWEKINGFPYTSFLVWTEVPRKTRPTPSTEAPARLMS